MSDFKIRENKINFWVHKDFAVLLRELQVDRIRAGTDNKVVPTWRLSKTVVNMIRANDELYNALKEVVING